MLTWLVKGDGWTGINEGLFQANKLQRWIKEYFNIKENLSKFKKREDRDGLELVSMTCSRGYVFVYPTQTSDRNIGKKTDRMERIYLKDEDRRLLKRFVDYEKELAGFSWRNK